MEYAVRTHTVVGLTSCWPFALQACSLLCMWLRKAMSRTRCHGHSNADRASPGSPGSPGAGSSDWTLLLLPRFRKGRQESFLRAVRSLLARGNVRQGCRLQRQSSNHLVTLLKTTGVGRRPLQWGLRAPKPTSDRIVTVNFQKRTSPTNLPALLWQVLLERSKPLMPASGTPSTPGLSGPDL